MLGRVMRLCEGKDTAEYYDFYDTYKWFRQASRARMEIFISQGHDVDKINANNIFPLPKGRGI
jgi:superfamily II DNA or RNA helicase